MVADPYRSAQTVPAGPAQADHQAPSDPARDDRRGRRHLNAYDPRSRTAVTPLLLMKSLDRIEAMMRAGTVDAFHTAQQEVHAMGKFMRQAGARTAEETSRREQLVALLDQVERRVEAMAARHANAAQGFAPFKAATTRSRRPSEGANVEMLAPNGIVAPISHGGASNVAARLPSVAPGFSVPAGGPAQVRSPTRETPPATQVQAAAPVQAMANDDGYVPFEMETSVEPIVVTRSVKSEEVDVSASAMPRTAHSVAQRMAAGHALPVLADLTEEERLALFT